MAEVMQKRGGDEFIIGTRLFRQCAALQRMFKLRHRLTAIGEVAVLLI